MLELENSEFKLSKKLSIPISILLFGLILPSCQYPCMSFTKSPKRCKYDLTKTLHPHLLSHHVQKVPNTFSFSPNLYKHYNHLLIRKLIIKTFVHLLNCTLIILIIHIHLIILRYHPTK
jgi:hypothetical protein